MSKYNIILYYRYNMSKNNKKPVRNTKVIVYSHASSSVSLC